LTRRFAWGFIVGMGLVFIFAARQRLNPLCVHCWRPWRSAIVDVLFVHQTIHFAVAPRAEDSRSGIAPAAAWIAMRGSLDPRILWLTAAVTLWTAGFDIIYACQDYAFDVSVAGLFSLPRRAGHRRGAVGSRACCM
jgi:4-hydroxybenzoate polyprenyltransferase